MKDVQARVLKQPMLVYSQPACLDPGTKVSRLYRRLWRLGQCFGVNYVEVGECKPCVLEQHVQARVLKQPMLMYPQPACLDPGAKVGGGCGVCENVKGVWLDSMYVQLRAREQLMVCALLAGGVPEGVRNAWSMPFPFICCTKPLCLPMHSLVNVCQLCCHQCKHAVTNASLMP